MLLMKTGNLPQFSFVHIRATFTLSPNSTLDFSPVYLRVSQCFHILKKSLTALDNANINNLKVTFHTYSLLQRPN